jgi:5-formyltetrahydrofolate cyclo-ligase
MVYVSKDPEVDTFPLIRQLLEEKKRVVVPIIQQKDRSLRLSYLTSLTTLQPSTFNVPEPIGNEIPADAERIEVAVIPLVGFDRKGNRIGYGAGYYDRFLQKNRQMVKIGVAFACQKVPSVPTGPFDIRMDVIITEKGVHRC